ncbi:hypothetical protein Mal64_35350 [Pseudobythopirellula maris]|uniref:Uncharacterized protein n=1 Tax=Pseudobythopirellula maris TaxID=2527991 RepID=A0A5C5ZHL2_9BACT|nr:hypothetical protein Mal64_35350 [Pseudobythopirellula maris]
MSVPGMIVILLVALIFVTMAGMVIGLFPGLLRPLPDSILNLVYANELAIVLNT